MSTQQSYRKSLGILLVSGLILQVGCRGWLEKPIVPDTGIAIPRRGILRVTKADGAVIGLRNSFITDDSIVGFLSDEPIRRAAFARTDVTKIEIRGDTTPKGLRIAGKVYLGVLAALGIALAVETVMWLYVTSHESH